MKLIFLSGMPGVGKLTVAQELAVRTGYKLFHNHLTVDLLSAVFAFGSEPFVELRESIWLSVFERAQAAGLPGLIFTFAPENTVRQEFIRKTMDGVASRGGETLFVELTCDERELERRLALPERARHSKLTSVEQYRQLKAAGVFDRPKLPKPRVSLDTSRLDPAAAAKRIIEECGLSGS